MTDKLIERPNMTAAEIEDAFRKHPPFPIHGTVIDAINRELHMIEQLGLIPIEPLPGNPKGYQQK